MSNLNKKILLFFMVVAVAFGLVGCTNPDNSVRIRFNVEEIEVRLNETKLLEPTIIKSSQVESVDLIFSSSDESIVKVEDGVLVPVTMGEAVVKVAWEDKDIIFDKVVVKVVKATLPRPTIAYDLAMLKGATQTVSVNLGSLNLTEAEYSFAALTPEIATISEEGVITAVAVGTAKFEIVVSDYEEEERYPISVTVAESDFAIKYELNGGTNHAENPVGYSALKLPLPLKDATKVGYEFLGWYEGANKVTEIAAGRLGDVELEAKWETEEYTISYEGIEGATFEAGYELPKAYTIESEEIVLAAPAKVGYKFLGWYAGEEKVEKIAKGSTGDVELEAEWEAEEYAISYDLAGGQWEELYTSFQEVGEAYLADFNSYGNASLNKNNYFSKSTAGLKASFGNAEMLAKWNWLLVYMLEDLKAYNAGSLEVAYVADTITMLELMIAGDTAAASASGYGPNGRTLIRAYLAGVMNLTKGSNGQENPNDIFTKYAPDFSLEENQKALLAAAPSVVNSYTIEDEVAFYTPARVGYEFLGWYDANGNKVEKIAKGSNGNVALTAKWELEEYAIDYNVNGGVVASEEVASVTAAANSNYWGNYKTNVFLYARGGATALYSFRIGFNKNAENGKYYVAGIHQSGESGSYDYDYYLMISEQHENYNALFKSLAGVAVGMQVEFDDAAALPKEVKFLAEGKLTNTYTIEDEVALPALQKVGYNFLGWYAGEQLVEKIAKGSTGDVELEAKWEAVEYTISYELDGGVNAEGNPDKYTIETETITLANPSKDGYIFVEWVEGDKVEKGSTGNKTFTAKWEVIPVYTISWDLAGGVLAEGETLVDSYKHGTPVALPTPTRYAHEFLGWYEGENKVTEIAGKNYELVAKWKNVTIESDNLVVVYDLVGGNWQEGQVPDADHPFAEMVGYIPVKEGYSFVKWDVVADNTVTPSITTLTAVWEVAVVYNITYDLAGGVAPEGNPATYTEFTPTFALVAATKEGYEFAGWYAGEQLVEKVELGSKGDLALVAKWTASEYEINYDLDGGVNAEGNPTTYTVESEEIVLAAPTKEGYKFLGWEDAEGNKVEKIAAGSKGNVELVAKWESLICNITYDLAGGQWELTPYTTHEEIKDAFIADFTTFINKGKGENEYKPTIDLQPDLTPNDEGKINITDFFGVSYNKDINGFFTEYNAKWGWLKEYITATATGQDLTSAAVLRACIHNFIYATQKTAWPVGHDYSAVKFDDYKANVPANLGEEFVPATTYVPGKVIELPVPVKEGAVFAGWTLNGEAFTFTTETNGDLALVATWK